MSYNADLLFVRFVLSGCMVPSCPWFTSQEVADLLYLSECTIRRYITLFHQTSDVKPVSCRSRPQKLLGDLWAAKVSKYMTHQCLFGLTKVVVTVETASENMAIASMVSVLCEVLNTLL